MGLLLSQEDGNICTLSINCPERSNGFSLELVYRLCGTLDASEDNGDVSVVFRGVGEEAFSSGMDLQDVDRVKVSQGDNPIDYAMGSVLTYLRPVIAMIYGAGTGAGWDLAVASDLRIATDTAVMGINPVWIGKVYPLAGLQRFIKVVGLS
ncbi:enoyl-CoA hydratase/isomerase family protein [Chloroflexota bacterium]